MELMTVSFFRVHLTCMYDACMLMQMACGLCRGVGHSSGTCCSGVLFLLYIVMCFNWRIVYIFHIMYHSPKIVWHGLLVHGNYARRRWAWYTFILSEKQHSNDERKIKVVYRCGISHLVVICKNTAIWRQCCYKRRHIATSWISIMSVLLKCVLLLNLLSFIRIL